MLTTTTPETTTTSNSSDHDDLLHAFCKWCEKADKRRAKKPTPFCGKKKDGPWSDSPTVNAQVCQMCVLLIRDNPCSRCGNRSYI